MIEQKQKNLMESASCEIFNADEKRAVGGGMAVRTVQLNGL